MHLETVLDDCLLLLTERMRLNNIRLDRQLQESLPAIKGNAVQLEQVLINIIQNAIDAQEESSAYGVITVKISARSSENFVTVEVSDSGPGIPTEYLDKIFDPFFTSKEEGKGTGLGLSIAYGIVKSHKGEIHYHPKGNVFIIRFPAGE